MCGFGICVTSPEHTPFTVECQRGPWLYRDARTASLLPTTPSDSGRVSPLLVDGTRAGRQRRHALVCAGKVAQEAIWTTTTRTTGQIERGMTKTDTLAAPMVSAVFDIDGSFHTPS
jgi:hypothetical protein